MSIVLPDYRTRRKQRVSRGVQCTVDTMRLQDGLVQQGYQAIHVIAFLTANEAYENLCYVRDTFGITSKDYTSAYKNLINALSVAMPYFCAKPSETPSNEHNDIAAQVAALLTRL